MIFLGTLGIFQVLFLPGLLAAKFLRFPKNFFIRLSSIISISLVLNYQLVLLLTSLGFFVRWLVLSIFGFEVILLFILYREQILNIKIEELFISIWNKTIQPIKALFPSVEEKTENRSLFFYRLITLFTFFIAAIVATEWISRFMTNNFGTVFDVWDAVVSWNPWAVQWANNKFPVGTQDYPQLMPTNWALIYLFIGSTKIQFFAKEIMAIFPLLIMLLLFSMGVQKKSPGFFIAVVVEQLILKKLSGEFLASGYVDIPLAFMVLLAVLYLVEIYDHPQPELKEKYYRLAILLASGACVVKQPAFYLLVWIILFGYILTFGKPTLQSIKSTIKKLLPILLIAFIIVAPWYIFKAVQITQGADISHILKPLEHTNSVHENASMISNILPGLLSLEKYFYVILFIIPSLLVIPRFWCWFGLLVVLPYITLWAAYASYDTRNLTIMFPFIAILFGLGVEGFLDLLYKGLERLKIRQIPLWVGCVVLLLATLGASLVWNNQLLEQKQLDLQKQLFSPDLNAQLYQYFEKSENQGKIMTNYPLEYLPGLEKFYVKFWFRNYEEFLFFIKDDKVRYLLYPSTANSEIIGFIDENVENGNFKEIFKNNNWIPYTFVLMDKKP